MLEPATTVIRICGGPEAVADMVRRDQSRVRRWTYPKDRGGTGGLIPTEVQPRLLAEARNRGIDLRPDHFFSVEQAAGAGQ
jgi:hypothetical protein